MTLNEHQRETKLRPNPFLKPVKSVQIPFDDYVMKIKRTIVAPMEAASPGLEKQGFFAVVFIYREYSVQRDG